MTRAEVLERIAAALPKDADVFSVSIDRHGEVKAETETDFTRRVDEAAAVRAGDRVPYVMWARALAEAGAAVVPTHWRCVKLVPETNSVPFDPFMDDYATARQILRRSARAFCAALAESAREGA
jgi:hypothetical protein